MRQVFCCDRRRRFVNRQATREQRLAIADRVIDNSGSLVDLERQVAEVWKWARSLPPAAPDAGKPIRKQS